MWKNGIIQGGTVPGVPEGSADPFTNLLGALARVPNETTTDPITSYYEDRNRQERERKARAERDQLGIYYDIREAIKSGRRGGFTARTEDEFLEAVAEDRQIAPEAFARDLIWDYVQSCPMSFPGAAEVQIEDIYLFARPKRDGHNHVRLVVFVGGLYWTSSFSVPLRRRS
jgi:hypothetical protein